MKGKNMEKKNVSRRDFAKKAALTGIAAGAFGTLDGAPYGSSKSKGSQFGKELIQPEHEGKEKHAPVITAPSKAKEGEAFEVEVSVGKEKKHPNSSAHHIKWIQLFTKEAGDTPMVHVATFDMGPGYADPRVRFPVILETTAKLYALAYCNLHGVWESSVTVKVS
jgi:superoxide reductase